ncbi:MAG: hypothetical protein ACYSSK_10025 [Planctomycetota bacterium]
MKNTIKYTAAAIILIAVTLSLTVWDAAVPNVMASELLTSAIEAVGNTYSIHIRAKLRTSPQDNFSHIDLEHDFVPNCGQSKVKTAECVCELISRVDN